MASGVAGRKFGSSIMYMESRSSSASNSSGGCRDADADDEVAEDDDSDAAAAAVADDATGLLERYEEAVGDALLVRGTDTAASPV